MPVTDLIGCLSKNYSLVQLQDVILIQELLCEILLPVLSRRTGLIRPEWTQAQIITVVPTALSLVPSVE